MNPNEEKILRESIRQIIRHVKHKRTDDENNPLDQQEHPLKSELEKELAQAKENELTILNTGYGAEAFKDQADYDIRVSKIPTLKNIFINQFYDEDGNYIGIQ